MEKLNLSFFCKYIWRIFCYIAKRLYHSSSDISSYLRQEWRPIGMLLLDEIFDHVT